MPKKLPNSRGLSRAEIETLEAMGLVVEKGGKVKATVRAPSPQKGTAEEWRRVNAIEEKNKRRQGKLVPVSLLPTGAVFFAPKHSPQGTDVFKTVKEIFGFGANN